jgi:hypothetical protein
VGAATTAFAGALATYPILRAGNLVKAVVPVAVLGLLATLLAMLMRGVFTGAALFILASEYLIVEVTGRAGSLSIIAYAVGLVVFCELLLWVGGIPRSTSVDLSVVVERLLGIGLAAPAAAVLAVVVLAAGELGFSGALEGVLVGSGAAIALLTLPRLFLRGRGSHQQEG